jgi:IS66 C-terminal element
MQTAKLDDVNPMAWLTDVLEHVVSGETKANELHQLFPWDWVPISALTITQSQRSWLTSNAEPLRQRQPCRPDAAYTDSAITTANRCKLGMVNTR